VGVPFGLYLGTRLGWQAPFLLLAALGIPIWILAALTLPGLRGHIAKGAQSESPLSVLIETFTHPEYLNAFALVVALMFAGFVFFPYVSTFFVSNHIMTEGQLPLMYIAGGFLSLFSSPLIGRLADRYGKLRVFRFVAPASAVVTLAVTGFAHMPVVVAVLLVASLMVTNSGRMVAAMAMITGSVAPARRGGFMSASSSVQHLTAGLATYVGGLVIVESADGSLLRFPAVGVLSAIATVASLWLAGRIRPIEAQHSISTSEALAAAAEALCDATEPVL
jgi:predicted MFS family arabinose efflux permease